MGIELKQETVTIERRYSSITIVKDLNKGNVRVNIEWVDGFYDENGNWVTTNVGMESINPDTVEILMSLDQNALGTQDGMVGTLLNTMAYGVITGQIPTTAQVTINAQDENGNPVHALINVYNRHGDLLLSAYTGTPFTTPAMLAPKIEIVSEGFEPFEKVYEKFVETVEDTVTLTAVPMEAEPGSDTGDTTGDTTGNATGDTTGDTTGDGEPVG